MASFSSFYEQCVTCRLFACICTVHVFFSKIPEDLSIFMCAQVTCLCMIYGAKGGAKQRASFVRCISKRACPCFARARASVLSIGRLACSHVPENEADQIGQTVYFQTQASGLLPHTHSNTSRQTFRSGN